MNTLGGGGDSHPDHNDAMTQEVTSTNSFMVPVDQQGEMLCNQPGTPTLIHGFTYSQPTERHFACGDCSLLPNWFMNY
jgi:hypothetical protein